MDSEPQTIRALLSRSEAVLVERGVLNARRNAEWILSQILGFNALELYTRSKSLPSKEHAHAFWEKIERRARREPLQYILGTTEFMSLPFQVPRGVFIPRPDTELLVETAEEQLRRGASGRRAEILDLCCGCGIIAVSLVRRLPGISAVAVDNSELAVQTTLRNAAINGVSGRFRCEKQDAVTYVGCDNGDPGRFSAILCNPPYIETSSLRRLPPEIRCHEPPEALDGGVDGLDFYRGIIPHLPRRLGPGGFVVFEIGEAQAGAVVALLGRVGLEEISVTQDYAGHDRVVRGLRGAG
jgi:release factor glutamine methyltransferase